MELDEDLRFERYCRLVNTTHSEIAPSLSLPSLPPCFGSVDQKIGLSDGLAGSRAGDLPEIIAHARTIAELLINCDVGYLNLKEDGAVGTDDPGDCSILYQEVTKFNHDAFKCFRPGPSQEWRSSNQTLEKKSIEQKVVKLKRVIETDSDDRPEKNLVNEPPSVTSRKPKMIRRETDTVPLTAGPDTLDQQGIVGNFAEMVEDFCSKAEFPDDLELADEQFLPLAEIKTLCLSAHIVTIGKNID